MAPPKPDFFPLAAGQRHKYRVSDAEGEGTLGFEVLAVAAEKGGQRARCRRRFERDGRVEQSEFAIYKDADGVVWAGENCLRFPVEEGRRWSAAPRDYSVASLGEVVIVPGGVFPACAKITYLIGGGDGGGGERYYAPDIGLVRELCQAEDEGFEWELVRVDLP